MVSLGIILRYEPLKRIGAKSLENGRKFVFCHIPSHKVTLTFYLIRSHHNLYFGVIINAYVTHTNSLSPIHLLGKQLYAVFLPAPRCFFSYFKHQVIIQQLNFELTRLMSIFYYFIIRFQVCLQKMLSKTHMGSLVKILRY
jgi:hypothetical protein